MRGCTLFKFFGSYILLSKVLWSVGSWLSTLFNVRHRFPPSIGPPPRGSYTSSLKHTVSPELKGPVTGLSSLVVSLRRLVRDSRSPLLSRRILVLFAWVSVLFLVSFFPNHDCHGSYVWSTFITDKGGRSAFLTSLVVRNSLDVSWNGDITSLTRDKVKVGCLEFLLWVLSLIKTN